MREVLILQSLLLFVNALRFFPSDDLLGKLRCGGRTMRDIIATKYGILAHISVENVLAPGSWFFNYTTISLFFQGISPPIK